MSVTRKELISLPTGAVVVHKRTGAKFTFSHMGRVADGLPPNTRNERPCAMCDRIPGVRYEYPFNGSFPLCFEAREISLAAGE